VNFIFNPVAAPALPKLMWQTGDWDPALRFWTLGFDPHLTVWLQTQDTWRISILAAREFAQQHSKWRFDNPNNQYYNDTDLLAAKHWLDPSHLAWKTNFGAIQTDIGELVDLMEDDRDRYLAEINAQADGLAAYIIAFLGIDGERKPWTIEVINCGLAIGNLVYMHYKQRFRRVRPSTLCPGLVPPFGPPRHPAFPSGHSFLGHFIALLLLEIPEVAELFGEWDATATPPKRTQTTLAKVMNTSQFTGPLLWLAARLAKNRERAGLHYPSDSAASRWIAGTIWALLTKTPTLAQPPFVGVVTLTANDMIDCPTLKHVLTMAKAEWAR
jgi:membrane-associated phospholipid phosphatase